jgi:hypothetical protein
MQMDCMGACDGPTVETEGARLLGALISANAFATCLLACLRGVWLLLLLRRHRLAWGGDACNSKQCGRKIGRCCTRDMTEKGQAKRWVGIRHQAALQVG